MISHFQILHVLERPCQGQKHSKLTGGNPRENQDVKSTAGSLESGSPADLAGLDYYGALGKAISFLEEGEGKPKGKEKKGGSEKVYHKTRCGRKPRQGVEGDLREQRNK